MKLWFDCNKILVYQYFYLKSVKSSTARFVELCGFDTSSLRPPSLALPQVLHADTADHQSYCTKPTKNIFNSEGLNKQTWLRQKIAIYIVIILIPHILQTIKTGLFINWHIWRTQLVPECQIFIIMDLCDSQPSNFVKTVIFSPPNSPLQLRVTENRIRKFIQTYVDIYSVYIYNIQHIVTKCRR